MRKLWLSILLLGGLLAACGGSHDDDGHAAMPPPPVSDGTPPADKFTIQVASLVMGMPDDAEAAVLDDAAPTMPEDTEPQAVP